MTKKIALSSIFFTLFLGICWGQNLITVTKAPDMPRAVSGHFAGIQDGELQTWGGCNFPDIPCADGGEKVFYPIAYGASVTVPEGTLYIGGTDGKSSLNDAGEGVPPLPKGLDNFAACYGMNRIFVAGGQTDGMPNTDVYALDWPDGKEWVKLCELPDEGRLQPCMAV